MIKDFLSLIFPENCVSCRRSLNSTESYLCTHCKIDLPFTNDHLNKYNRLFQKFAFEPKIKSASSFLYFQRHGVTQKLLHEIKYKGKKKLALQIGKWYSSYLTQIDVDLVVPIPLHKSKFRKRTYNQSELIGKGIADELNLPQRSDLCIREVATETQTSKTKAQRWLNMENVYSECIEDLSGQSIMLVDDVITTGATVGMFCQRLVESNVKEIHIVSVARGN